MDGMSHPQADHALVLFSGGQDSTTCLAWALARYDHVETVGFDYGQRHRIELDCRAGLRARLALHADWRARLGPDHTIDLPAIGRISQSALTSQTAIAFNADGLPNTFVPGRNLIFLAFAAALAARRGLRVIVGGMCETDFSGYPDCRDDAVKAMQVALNIGMAQRFAIETPLMWIDKAATWRLAERLGGAALVNLIVSDTHTCYLGERGVLHSWGHGCGACPACVLRAQGYAAYRGVD